MSDPRSSMLRQLVQGQLAQHPASLRAALHNLVAAWPEGLVNCATILLQLAQLQAEGADVLEVTATVPAGASFAAGPVAKRPRLGQPDAYASAGSLAARIDHFIATLGLDERTASALKSLSPEHVEATMRVTHIRPECRNPNAVVMANLRDQLPAKRAAAANLEVPRAMPVAAANTVASDGVPEGTGEAPEEQDDEIGQFVAHFGLDRRTDLVLRDMAPEDAQAVMTMSASCDKARNPNAVVLSNVRKRRETIASGRLDRACP
eukprot:TRINITY_DN67294_c0_g1_i1.p1 TRINITY_DN67294_c0_g1~~TRINITY_DN67294_c0_g1_i1.p1  ORF type:complete len:289 (+),score=87.16 TRINITY_DN67294_c0_g1_i1:80-868(+)